MRGDRMINRLPGFVDQGQPLAGAGRRRRKHRPEHIRSKLAGTARRDQQAAWPDTLDCQAIQARVGPDRNLDMFTRAREAGRIEHQYVKRASFGCIRFQQIKDIRCNELMPGWIEIVEHEVGPRVGKRVGGDIAASHMVRAAARGVDRERAGIINGKSYPLRLIRKTLTLKKEDLMAPGKKLLYTSS